MRAIILGLDGLSWDYFERLRKQGYLTGLVELSSKGVGGSIETIPPFTPVMWTSITSGVNPGKHGIYLFYHTTPGGRVLRINRSTNVMHPRLHDMLSQVGEHSLIANLPLSSYPYVPFKGALISDTMSPKPYARPEQLNHAYMESLRYAEEELSQEPWCTHISHNLAIMTTLAETSVASRYLSESRLVFIMIDFFDKVAHLNGSEVVRVSSKCFRRLIEELERFIRFLAHEQRDDNDLLLVVSDHGNAPINYRVSLTRILYDEGMIEPRMESLEETMPALQRTINTTTPITTLTRLLNLLTTNRLTGPLLTRIGRAMLNRFPHLRNTLTGIKRPVPDPEKSTTIVQDFAIYINEETNGQDADKLIQATIRALKKAEELTGHKFIYTLLRGKNHYYKGPHTSNAPHLVIVPKPGYDFSSTNLFSPILTRAENQANHTPHNLHIILPPIDKEEEIKQLAQQIKQPWDYTALVLHALGHPQPHDTDSQLTSLTKHTRYRDYNTRYKLSLKIAQTRHRL